MADQASGYLQRKMDLARKTAIQEKLAAVRESGRCCGRTNEMIEGAGTNSGYLYGRLEALPTITSLRSGVPASAQTGSGGGPASLHSQP